MFPVVFTTYAPREHHVFTQEQILKTLDIKNRLCHFFFGLNY
jgi:hypothetical protein